MKYIELLKMINDTKSYFEKELEDKLNIIKVQSPLFVRSDSGLQDDLTGVEKGISFIKDNEHFEIVHSLAKWKREALHKYKFNKYTGLYTDMKAIRRDETVDNIHSLFVGQWDFEKVIDKKDRNINYLKETVESIYECLKETDNYISNKYKLESLCLPKSITFITSQELEDMYPNCNPKEREKLIAQKYKSVFLIGIGDKLKSGIPHDLRSPDYDDWSLNGDILIYDDVLNNALEITSMGIRVDEKSLIEQLKKCDKLNKLDYPYHQKIINKTLPYTIGGGIGISRVLMLLLKKSHIAQIQSSSWDNKTLKYVKNIL